MRRRPRPTPFAAGVLLLAALAGCGGGGGDPAAYGRAYERACTAVRLDVQTVTDSARRAAGRTPNVPSPKAVPELRSATVAFYDSISRHLGDMAAADPPKEHEGFQRDLRRQVERTDRNLAAAKRQISGVRTLTQYRSAQDRIGASGKGLPSIRFPEDLVQRAPSCAGFGGT